MYPFTSFEHDEITKFADTLQLISNIHEKIDPKRNCTRTLEATTFVFKFLAEECQFEGTVFFDCLGRRAEASLYAAVFGVVECISCEMYEPFVRRGQLLCGAFKPEDSKIDIELGAFQDFFRFDATIIYIDVAQLIDISPFVDEGYTTRIFFEMCTRTLPGSHCIVVSYNSTFSPQDDFDCKYVQVVHHTAICRHTKDECYVYICKILSDMSV